MEARKLTFYSDGIRLRADLFLPPDYVPGERWPAMLVCHGRLAIKDWVPSRWIPPLLDAGYICMAFDYRNLGESDGPLGQIFPDLEVRDVHSATTLLQQQPEVDPDSIGIIGWGLGGGVVVAAAAEDERLKAVISASAVANGEAYGRHGMPDAVWEAHQRDIADDRVQRVLTGSSDWYEIFGGPEFSRQASTNDSNGHQSYLSSLASAVGQERAADRAGLRIPEKVTLESMERLYSFKPDAVAHKISPRPLLVVHGDEDRAFPIEHARHLFDHAGEPKSFITVEGGGHLEWIEPGSQWREHYFPQVIGWLTQQIPPRSHSG